MSMKIFFSCKFACNFNATIMLSQAPGGGACALNTRVFWHAACLYRLHHKPRTTNRNPSSSWIDGWSTPTKMKSSDREETAVWAHPRQRKSVLFHITFLKTSNWSASFDSAPLTHLLSVPHTQADKLLSVSSGNQSTSLSDRLLGVVDAHVRYGIVQLQHVQGHPLHLPATLLLLFCVTGTFPHSRPGETNLLCQPPLARSNISH